MGRLQIRAEECRYNKLDKCLIEQITNGLHSDGIIVEIICEVTSHMDTSSVTSEQVLTLARKVEHSDKNVLLSSLKKKEEFQTG